MNMIILFILIATAEYLDKTVLNLELRTQVKERDELLAWLKLSIKLIGDIEPDTAADMIRN